MSLVVFRRLSSAPPPERELLTVADDGRVEAWRSNGAAVGRFAGTAPDLEALRAAVAAARAGSAPAAAELPAGASVEEVEIEGATARFEARAPVDGAWAPLVEACRSLLDSVVASPVAAIGLDLDEGGGMRLEHRGTETLPIELASLRTELVLWRDGAEAARGGTSDLGLGRVEAGPGWAVELQAPSMDLSGGGKLVATASFVADDGGVFVPVTITARSRS